MIDEQLEILSVFIVMEMTKHQYDHPVSTIVYLDREKYMNYGLYESVEKRRALCQLFVEAGFSCRIGIGCSWNCSIAMQSGYIELSTKIKFDHVLAEDYHKELVQGLN